MHGFARLEIASLPAVLLPAAFGCDDVYQERVPATTYWVGGAVRCTGNIGEHPHDEVKEDHPVDEEGEELHGTDNLLRGN